MDVLEVFLILIFGVPIISLLAFGWIAADWMQRQEAQAQQKLDALYEEWEELPNAAESFES